MSELQTRPQPIRILLVEDDPEDTRTIWNLLHEKSSFQFQLDAVTRIPEAVAYLRAAPVDVVLLDLALLSYEEEAAALATILARAPRTAVIVITELAHEAAGLRALKSGAQDYLLKEEIGTRSLVRALHYAVERQRAEEAYRAQVHQLEQRRLLTVEAAGVGDWEFDLTTKEFYWSPRMFNLIGVSPDTVPSFDLLVAHVHPEDRQHLLNGQAEALSGVNNGKYQVQLRIEHRERELRWLEAHTQVMFADPIDKRQPVRITGLMIDITPQKRIELAEREQRFVAEALRDTAAELSDMFTLDAALERALAAARHLMTYDAAYVILFREGKFVDFHTVGLLDEERITLESWHRRLKGPATHAHYRRAAASMQPVIHPDLGQKQPKLLPIAWARSTTVVPIASDYQLIGYFVGLSRTAEHFLAADSPKLHAFSFQIATAVSNARHFINAQELAVLKERENFARELHDAVSQTLFTASVLLEGLPWHQAHQPQAVPDLIAQLLKLVKGASAELRTLILEMRQSSVQATPFRQLLHQLIAALQTRKRIEVQIAFEGEPALLPEVKLVVFRITQEAFNNITKHSLATEIVVRGRGGQGLIELSISDNGRGFSPQAQSSGLGLKIMRERAEEIDAALEIQSTVGQGTEVKLRYPRADTRKQHHSTPIKPPTS